MKLVITFALIAMLLVAVVPSALAQSAKTPVIILFNDKISDKQINLVKSVGGDITRNYKLINGVAANLPQNAIENISSSMFF